VTKDKAEDCVRWWWIFRDWEITKGGAARVFEGGDGHGFTQLRGYHYSQVLITIIAEINMRALGGVGIRCIPIHTTIQTVSIN
jgi:hypothetical protein